jgi:Asp-tRNAAsn/Glu-tRNAGln amidotransferase B subunit (PET112 homolog)
VIAPEWIERVRSEMTELPRVMAARFVADYGLSEYDANGLTQSKALARYFESVFATCGLPKLAANWVLGEVSAFINKNDLVIDDVEVPNPIAVGEIIKKIAGGEINGNGAKTAFQELCLRLHKDIADLATFLDQIIQERGLKQMNDAGALETIVDAVLAANPKNIEQYKAGNSKALNALVGQIMKASQGKANPSQVNELLRAKLG